MSPQRSLKDTSRIRNEEEEEEGIHPPDKSWSYAPLPITRKSERQPS